MKELEADLEEIVDLKNRQGNLGYFGGLGDGYRGKETPIAETKLSPTEYDLIIVGTPVWSWSPTPAIRTYLAKNKGLSGKKVALFFTQNGELKPYAIEKTKALMPNASVKGVLTISKALSDKAETEKKVVAWCTTLKQ
jgi:flavodoxin